MIIKQLSKYNIYYILDHCYIILSANRFAFAPLNTPVEEYQHYIY
nr:MAG TPA: hypothetical protein [Crassvirales sp.]